MAFNGSGALGGAASGASAGAAFGPWGAAIGGVGGGLLGGFGGKGGGEPPPDYMGAAERQTQANRPNQNTAWGSTSWQQGPDGQWTQNQTLNPELQGLFGQAIQNQQQGIDYGALPGLTDGAAARDQAITGAYNQATSRLDPRFQQAEDAQRTRMYNMGLTEGDAAYEQQMGNFARDKNDAYSSAMNGAIAQGTQAGASLFNQSLAGRQQMLGEATQQMNQPMQGFNSLLAGSGALNMPGFMPSGNYLGAAGMAGGYGQTQQGIDNGMQGSMFGAMGSLGSAVVNARR
jgi:hypothetical protein